jgi:hypothetical protein
MRTISAGFLFALLSVCAARAWLDYASAVPIPGQVSTLHRGREGARRTREYDFGSCRYTVVDRDALLERFLGLFGAGAPELRGVVEGDRVPLWTSLVSGRATPVRRLPIVTTLVPLVYLLLLFAERRTPVARVPWPTVARTRPDGSTEVRQDRHRCLGCIFLETALVMGVFGALVLVAWGLIAPFLEGEQSLREGLAFVTVAVLLVPVITVVRRLEPVPTVRWNESTVWIQGVSFPRSGIREVVMRNGILEIHREGSRWKRSFAQEASWIGAQLEKLGFVVRET